MANLLDLTADEMALIAQLRSGKPSVSSTSGMTIKEVDPSVQSIQAASSDDEENIFDDMPEYGAKWEVLQERLFNGKELASMQNQAVVKTTQYGMSMCFFMNNGKTKYIPIDKGSRLMVGDTVNVADVIMRKLKNVSDPHAPIGKILIKVDLVSNEENEQVLDFNNPLGI